MYSLTIAFGETPAMWRLLFKTEEAAQKAVTILEQVGQNPHPENIAGMMDDFGQLCAIKWSGIKAWMLEDLDQSKQAGVEMMLHNARTQADANVRARSEPSLRQATSGPSVFVPNGGGRLNG
jgi:hypothetical protein